MLHGEQRGLFDVSFAIPAECADRLAGGRADIGIVPCIELTRQKLEVIPGAGIACDGPVRSILLISKVPFPEIRMVAADSSSRTSVMLTRIVLSKKYGVEPEVISRKPELPAMLDEADACLIIGDPALLIEPHEVPFHVLDLGNEWKLMTGLPMVFAVWAAGNGVPRQSPEPFLESLRFGRAHLAEIVESEYQRRGISRELAHEYLTRHIRFELGPREYQGMALFLKYATELPNSADLRKVSV